MKIAATYHTPDTQIASDEARIPTDPTDSPPKHGTAGGERPTPASSLTQDQRPSSLRGPESAGHLDLRVIRRAAEARLEKFLDAKAVSGIPNRLADDVARTLRDFLFAGGKRIRPVLCALGWYAGGGRPGPLPTRVAQVAASLEMFHAFALIHDDLMDRSDTRRGRPTLHRACAVRHQQRHHRDCAASEHIGEASAVLLGDLALVWSDELLHTAGLAPGVLETVLPLFNTMRTEVMYGQYLDVLTTGHPSADVETTTTVIRYKTAKYTFERPLQIGAAMAGAAPSVADALSSYALPLGEAFQLRDDLLGVFGDPALTGKSVLDDLREGKNTALSALAMQRASTAQLQVLTRGLGRPDLGAEDAARVRTVFEQTGARATVEQMIATRHALARRALADAGFPDNAGAALRDLADSVELRSS
ncbi:polyprenyl synthetase family protein [Streptomyces sp. NPDC002523]